MDEIRAEVRVTGVVQGVGYRVWTLNTARELGIRGWVRNEPDGTVSAVMVGPRDAVDDLLERCKQGPPPADVEVVAAAVGVPRADEAFTEFRIT